MDTKEAIEFCEMERQIHSPTHNYEKCYSEVISLLKQGEKYKKMWADVERLFTAYSESNLKHIKQRYFPVSRTRKEIINELINSIYSLNVTPRADKVDIVNSLIELRDKEEKV